MKDLRPISCSSVIYKCITRISIDRMTSFLPKLNAGNQSAFIHAQPRKSLSPRCAMKIDLQKAFNFLTWDSIFATLEALGFPLLFIHWIRSCVTQPWYSISFNGGLVGYFKDAKGTRQGDLLSPYLFVTCMNVLSKMLDIQYYLQSKNVKLTHLSFADDLLIFAEGNLESVCWCSVCATAALLFFWPTALIVPKAMSFLPVYLMLKCNIYSR